MSKIKRKKRDRPEINLDSVNRSIIQLELPHQAYELLCHVADEETSSFLHHKVIAWLDKYESVYGAKSPRESEN